jgi:hypothetical protein
MRSRAIAAFAVLAVLAGCGRPPYPQSLKLMETELTLYFANLNNDAEQRKLDVKTPRTRIDDPITTGRIYSDYLWSPDESLVIVTGVECLRCKTKQIVPLYRVGTNGRVICPTCAAGDDKGDKATKAPPLLEGGLSLELLKQRCGEKNVHRMFEPASEAGPKEPVKAKISYVRRLWVYDPYGKVDYLGKNATEVQAYVTDMAPYTPDSYIDVSGTPSAPNPNPQKGNAMPIQNNYYAGGFHRLDSVYVGELDVEFDGSLKVIGQAKEEGLRPWNAPRSMEGPKRYQTRTTK